MKYAIFLIIISVLIININVQAGIADDVNSGLMVGQNIHNNQIQQQLMQEEAMVLAEQRRQLELQNELLQKQIEAQNK